MGNFSSKVNLKVVNQLEENDKLILLLGETGAGKSKFLDLICEGSNAEVSNRVDSRLMSKDGGFCFVRLEVENKSIVVMDSKGIVESSKEIKRFLSSKCLGKRNIQLLGVLLLQDFNTNRSTGDSHDTRFPYFGIVREICGGSECMQKTYLVLTHFDPKRVQDSKAHQERYKAYCAAFTKWFPGKEGQRSIFEHTNTSQSARLILSEIAGRGVASSGTH